MIWITDEEYEAVHRRKAKARHDQNLTRGGAPPSAPILQRTLWKRRGEGP